MATPQTDVQSRTIELAADAMDTFCEDISSMFGVPMKTDQADTVSRGVKDLKKDYKRLAAACSVRSEGVLDGPFHLIFDKEGMFTLAGLIVMQPEARIQENRTGGTASEASDLSDAIGEVGNLLIGSWDRIFRDEMDGHGHFVQSNTYIGNICGNAEEALGLADDAEFLFVPFEMTIGSYPPFSCGAIFPMAIFGAETQADEAVEAESQADSSNEPDQPVEEAQGAEQAAPAEQASSTGQAESPAPESAAASQPADEAPAGEKKEQAAPTAEEPAKEQAAEGQATVPNEATVPAEAREQSGEPAGVAEDAKEDTSAKVDATAESTAERTGATQDSGSAETPSEESASVEESQPAGAEGEDDVEIIENPDDTGTAGQAEAGVSDEPDEAAEDKAAASEDSPADEASDQAGEDPGAETSQQAETAGTPEVEISESVTTVAPQPATGGISQTIQKMTQSPAILPGEHAIASLQMHALDIMCTEIAWGGVDDTVEHALTKMQQHDAGYMLVGHDGKIDGMVSKSDLAGAVSPYLRPAFAKWRRPLDDATLQLKIKWVMTRPVRTVTPETTLARVIEHMCRSGGRCLPVIDKQGQALGLITVFDIFKTLLEQDSNISIEGRTPQAPPLL